MCKLNFKRCAYCLNRLYFNSVKKIIKGDAKRFHRSCLIEYEQVSEMTEIARIQHHLLEI